MFIPRVSRALTATRLLFVLLAAGVCAAPAASAVPEPIAPPDFVDLADIDPTILVDARYAGEHNFTGDRIDGYDAPICLLARPAAQALQRAQQEFLERGYTLKVYDCYRPQRAVDDFVAWASDPRDQRMKSEFYPRVDKARLFDDGYIADKSGHSRGSTVDLTLVALPAPATPVYLPGQPLVDCTAPVTERFPDNSIDMGTGYDCFDTLAHTLDPRIQGDQLKNRLLLKEGLERQGLVNYENEWWHYTLRPEAYPDSYFDFPVARESLAATH